MGSISRSRIDGPTRLSFEVSRPGGYRLSVTKRHCEDDVRATIAVQTRDLPAETSRKWIELESRFDEAETQRLEYREASSRDALRKLESLAEEGVAWGYARMAVQAARRAALVLETLGELERSNQHLTRALRLARQESDGSLETLERLTLAELGRSEVLLGRTDEGERLCDEARSRSESSNDPRSLAEATYCIAEAHYHRGDFTHALETHASLLQLANELDNRWLEARALLDVAYSQSDLGELELADENFTRALERWDRLGEKRFHALTLVALGRLSLRLGENQRALERFEEGMAVLMTMGDDVWKASAEFGFGDVAFNLGDYERALVHFRVALDLYQSSGLRMAVLEALNSLGITLLATGEHDEASRHFDEALELSRSLGITREESWALLHLGAVRYAAGEATAALDFYERSLARLPDDATRQRAQTLNALGVAQRSLGRTTEARVTFAKALELSRLSRDQFQEASSLYYLAAAAAASGDLPTARTQVERAIELAESLRGRVLSRELRASYFASVHEYYELYIDVLMRASEGSPSLVAQAFQASEQASARSLLENLAESHVDIRQGVDGSVLASELRVRELYNAKALLELELYESGADETRRESIAHDLDVLAARYDLIQSRIRSQSPRFASLTQPTPWRLEEIQRNLLDEDSLLLEYALGRERSYLWIVSKDRIVPATLPPGDELETRARSLYELLTARQRRGDETPRQWRRLIARTDAAYAREARELSRLLLGPAVPELKGRRRLIVAADGALQYVPFGALPLDWTAEEEPRPVISQFEVVRAPSASVVAEIRRVRLERDEPLRRVAIFADPVFSPEDPRLGERGESSPHPSPSADFPAPLRALSLPRVPATRAEAEAIRAVSTPGETHLALGLDAARDVILDSDLRSYEVIHFATHGVVDDARPDLSGVVLSMVDERGLPRDGFLRLHDIYNLALSAELVVLSACDTALGRLLRGEGLVGLVRGFMYAGARGVVASLWKVDDEATRMLMVSFYENLLRHRRTSSDALRLAQLTLLADDRFDHPYYWAAFELHGDWR